MADTANTKKKKGIFSLPPEIRNRIWFFALEGQNQQCTRKRRVRPCRWCEGRCLSYREPALLSVSRQVRSESQGVWYASTIFYFHDGTDKLLEFLVFLGNHKTAKITSLKDEPSFGKPLFAREFLEDAYSKIHSLGIQLPQSAIEVTCHEGVRLLRSTWKKETKVAMRKRSNGEIGISSITTPGSEESDTESNQSDEDEYDLSDSTLPNSDAESDITYDESDGSETLA